MAKQHPTVNAFPEQLPSSRKLGEPSIDVQDAWDETLEIMEGLEELLSIGYESDKGFNPKGIRALHITALRIVELMKTVDGYFNPGRDNE